MVRHLLFLGAAAPSMGAAEIAMNLKRLALLTGSLGLSWLPACSDPCTDDGFFQDSPEGCEAAGTDGGSTSDTLQPTTAGPTTDPQTSGADDSTGPDPTDDSTGASCTNRRLDGDESDVDCGGSCEQTCDDGQNCGANEDCTSSSCSERGVCEPATCKDGLTNGDETDQDCGGACPPCDDGSTCAEGNDCASGVCDGARLTCTPASCDDGVQNGDETDQDCGGADCDPCDDGQTCAEATDCTSGVCEDESCSAATCDDGVQNGDETDQDCGGGTCPGCDPGADCEQATDCASAGCDDGTNTCNALLSVVAGPGCSTLSGTPVTISATAMGGTGGPYTYSWTPDDGSLSTPAAAMTDADPAGLTTYTVTADDGTNTALDTVVVVNADPFDLENNCTLYQGDFGGMTPATIDYDMGGTRACENGNNGFGLHLCEGVTFENTRLSGTLEVTDAAGDDDFVGLVWGAQDNSHFYSMAWKGAPQMGADCMVPAGIVVKRVEAADFDAIDGADVHCPADTDDSTLLLDPSQTTTEGWSDTTSYTVLIDYTAAGSDITVTRDSDDSVVTSFTVTDTTFASGFFGSTTRSQANACVGPLFSTCL